MPPHTDPVEPAAIIAAAAAEGGGGVPVQHQARLLGLLLSFLRGHVIEGLEVKPSTVPAAGQGLFAARSFPADELVCVYSGTSVSLAEALRRKAAGVHGDYVMSGFGLNWRVDAGDHPEVMAR